MDDLVLALHAARAGAAVVRGHFGRVLDAEYKRRFDPVTLADRESEDAIVGLLEESRPEYGILAEEGAGAAADGRRWIIDPLDGTVNFVHGIPQLGVSVALYDDDTAVLGVTTRPVKDSHGMEISEDRLLSKRPVSEALPSR